MDASYFKVQQMVVYKQSIACGHRYSQDGFREVLSASVADSEDEYCREGRFEDLKAPRTSRCQISDI